MKNEKGNMMKIFGGFFLLLCLLFVFVIYKIFVIQFVEKEAWDEVASKIHREFEVDEPAKRGNIYSCDGRLMASSIPSYKLYWDARVPYLQQNPDSFYKSVDSLAYCFATMFNDKTQSEYRKIFVDAYRKKEGRLSLCSKEISYFDFQKVSKFPVFSYGKIKGGLVVEDRLRRQKPFGSLASRTIGNIQSSNKKGYSGIEKKYDKVLQGRPGKATVQRFAGRNKSIKYVVEQPQNGLDITTTINMGMQDIAEKSLRNVLTKIDAERGCAVLMDVKTGEIKACSNLIKDEKGVYVDSENMAANAYEPGSTFKIFSLMIALEDGVCDTNTLIDTKDGVYNFYGRKMVDHNHDKGGYGKITVAQGLAYSSNIVVSKIIEDNYKTRKEKFVNALYDIGLNKPLDIEIPGLQAPKIKHPKDSAVNWSGTTLPWMSIGYEVQIPPIYTLAYYNAIANDGCFIQPFLVKNIVKNGEVLEEFSTQVINKSICSQSTLQKVRSMLEGVVDYGTGKAAASKSIKIAGKTGTAQIGYKNNRPEAHLLTFCGYFPADNPLYTCVVSIKVPNRGYSHSAGATSGVVFKNIAEQIYAQKVRISPNEFAEMCELKKKSPCVKKGIFHQTQTVLSELGLDFVCENKKANWVQCSNTDSISLEFDALSFEKNVIPDVIGMGAKDAVYLMEKNGVRVYISGAGRVVSQSIKAGTSPRKGDVVYLSLK